MSAMTATRHTTAHGCAECAARLVLSVLADRGDGEAIKARVVRDGPVMVLAALRSGDGELDPHGRARALVHDTVADKIIEEIRQIGVRHVCPGGPGWPQRVSVESFALGLWTRGSADLGQASRRSVTVLGARTPTRRSSRLVEAMAFDLAASGWTVVSEAMPGICEDAHRGALAAGFIESAGVAVAVVPCGVNVVPVAGYASSTRLLERVADTGLIVSEARPYRGARGSGVAARRRLVASLSAGTVIVEAPPGSRAVSAAKQADQLGRVVMAVPADGEASAECRRLIHAGAAVPVTCAADVIAVLNQHASANSEDRR